MLDDRLAAAVALLQESQITRADILLGIEVDLDRDGQPQITYELNSQVVNEGYFPAYGDDPLQRKIR